MRIVQLCSFFLQCSCTFMSVCCGIKNKGIFFSHIFHNKYCCCCWLRASFFFRCCIVSNFLVFFLLLLDFHKQNESVYVYVSLFFFSFSICLSFFQTKHASFCRFFLKKTPSARYCRQKLSLLFLLVLIIK
jgi:hypothetical protein